MIKGLTTIFKVERLASDIRPTSQCISFVFMYVHVITCTGGSHVAGSYVDILNRCPVWCAMNLRSTLRKASVEQNSVISICISAQLRITISWRRSLHNPCDGLSNPSFSSHGQIDQYCASQLRSVAQGQTDRKTDRQKNRVHRITLMLILSMLTAQFSSLKTPLWVVMCSILLSCYQKEHVLCMCPQSIYKKSDSHLKIP